MEMVTSSLMDPPYAPFDSKRIPLDNALSFDMIGAMAGAINRRAKEPVRPLPHAFACDQPV